MRNPFLAAVPAVAALIALAGCRDLTPPQESRPLEGPSFSEQGLSADSVGICLPVGSPSGSYTFSWTIQNGQAGDIHQDTSPATLTIGGANSGGCLLPWRRETPLPAGVFVDVIVTEVSAPAGVALDSVEVQDRFGDHVYLSATDTASVDTTSGGTLVYYHQPVGPLVHVPLPVSLLPLPGQNPSMASGEMRMTLDPTVPPSPCGPVRASSGRGVALCGTIRNPGGETFTRGVLMAAGRTIPFAETALPPNPCRQYVMQGAVTMPAGLVTQWAGDPTGLTVRFDTQEHPDGAIGGSFAARAGTMSGSGAAEAGVQAGTPSGNGACVVRFGP